MHVQGGKEGAGGRVRRAVESVFGESAMKCKDIGVALVTGDFGHHDGEIFVESHAQIILFVVVFETGIRLPTGGIVESACRSVVIIGFSKSDGVAKESNFFHACGGSEGCDGVVYIVESFELINATVALSVEVNEYFIHLCVCHDVLDFPPCFEIAFLHLDVVPTPPHSLFDGSEASFTFDVVGLKGLN